MAQAPVNDNPDLVQIRLVVLDWLYMMRAKLLQADTKILALAVLCIRRERLRQCEEAIASLLSLI